jgi:hypothetical protein
VGTAERIERGFGKNMGRKGFEEIMRAAGKAVARTARDVAATEPPIVLHLDKGEIGALDLWIANQPDPKPDRADAARMLLNEVLAKK